MKKYLIICIATVLVLTMVGCSTKKDNTPLPSLSEEQESKEEKPNIADATIETSDVGVNTDDVSQDAEDNNSAESDSLPEGSIVTYDGFVIDANGTLIIPETVTALSTYNFAQNANIKKIVFPDSLIEIPDFVCSTCENLEEVIIGENTEIIGDDAFFNCPKLTTVHFNDKLKEIGECSFAGFGNCLTRVELPDSIEHIEYSAFGIVDEYFTIVGTPGTYIEEFAKEVGCTFEVK